MEGVMWTLCTQVAAGWQQTVMQGFAAAHGPQDQVGLSYKSGVAGHQVPTNLMSQCFHAQISAV